MMNIDKYAYMSKLKHTDPLQKLIFSVLTLCVCLWADSIQVSALVLLIMGWCTVYKGGTPLVLFLKMMMAPTSFLVIGVLPIAVNLSLNKEIFLFSISIFGAYAGVTQSSIQTAAHLVAKALGAVACLYYLALNTPMVDLLAVLHRLKIPTLFIELMGLIYRFIFILFETAETMFTAQSSRLGYTSLASSYRALAALATTLFISAFKRSDELYTALEARGYDGELNVLEEPFKAHWTEYIFPGLVNLFLILIACFEKMYWG
jgi:cobalt/nickel transport system permease protein